MSLSQIFFRYLCVLQGLFLLGASPLLHTTAQAATYQVDDTGSRISSPVLPMYWRKLVPGSAQDNTAEGSIQVALRLNLSSWVGKRVRLYIALAPRTGGDSVRASWRTGGRLMPATMLSGGRTVIFEGVIASPTFEETLDMTLAADGRTLETPQSLQFSFEIETP